MKFIKLIFSPQHSTYLSKDASSLEMSLLGRFLAVEVGHNISKLNKSVFKDWVLANKEDPTSGFTFGIGGNITFLEEQENGDICIYDRIGSSKYRETPHEEISISREQFIKLLDDWEEKVCKHKPKEVIIKRENDKFVIETSD